MNKLKFSVPQWPQSGNIPAEYAFGKIGIHDEVTASNNLNPQIIIESVPEGTEALALLLVDPDVPQDGTQVNQSGIVIEASARRGDFYHCVLANIPPNTQEIPKGALSNGITEGGKPLGLCAFGVQGLNNYTEWFSSDPQLEGLYGGYDGPCPPANDSITHRYIFELFALAEPLTLPEEFCGEDLRHAAQGLIIDQAQWQSYYTLNESAVVA